MPDDHVWYGTGTSLTLVPLARGTLWVSPSEQGYVSLYLNNIFDESRLMVRITYNSVCGYSRGLARFAEAGWSEEAQQLAIVLCEDYIKWPRQWQIDGLLSYEQHSVDRNAVVRIHRFDGSVLTAMRAPNRISYWTGIRADWSPDGRWLTVGGFSLEPAARAGP